MTLPLIFVLSVWFVGYLTALALFIVVADGWVDDRIEAVLMAVAALLVAAFWPIVIPALMVARFAWKDAWNND